MLGNAGLYLGTLLATLGLPAFAGETLQTSAQGYGPRPGNGSSQTVYPAIGARADKDVQLGSQWRAHGEGEFSLNPAVRSQFYVNVPEIYATDVIAPSWDLSFGRKRQEWSRLDQVWQQGLWQPRFRWNYFDPEVIGLTGVFAENSSETFASVLYATPLFIPEQIAPYRIENGQFETDHPFFVTPPNEIPLFGQSAAVRYALVDVNIARIVLHPGAGAMARWGRKEGSWVKTSYAYQPMNQILLGYEGFLSLTSSEVNVTLHPRVLYHHLASVEGGVRRERGEFWASLTGDRPMSDGSPGSWTTQVVSPSLLAAVGAEATVFGRGSHAARVQTSYLRRWSGIRSDQGPLAVTTGSIFESRFSVQNAVQVSASTPLNSSYQHRFSALGRGIYDFSVSGALLTAELRYQTAEHWSLTLGGDAVGAVYSRSEAAGGADLFYLYRHNSRVRGSFAYAF